MCENDNVYFSLGLTGGVRSKKRMEERREGRMIDVAGGETKRQRTWIEINREKEAREKENGTKIMDMRKRTRMREAGTWENKNWKER